MLFRSGSAVPTTLKEQLAPGGRLLMPVSRSAQSSWQHLRKLKRLSLLEYEDQDLGPVAFVPLVSVESEGTD